VADLLVVGQEIPLREEDSPIAFVAANQGLRSSARIRHVSADIRKVFEKPEHAKGESGGLPVPEKVGGAEQRDNQFAERSAQDADGVAKPTEEKMAGFVNHQVGEIEKEEAGSIGEGVKEKETIEHEPGNARDARNWFPVAELIF